MDTEWSIHDIARLTGVTTRTLRHYGDLHLVQPSRVGANGYRYYDRSGLVRLQRVLLLRDLGLSLARIAQILDDQVDPVDALRAHVDVLLHERERLAARIDAVRHTIDALLTGGTPMPQDMFDGFDHSAYREEVEERWGLDARARADSWWAGMDRTRRHTWSTDTNQLVQDWIDAAHDPDCTTDSARAQALAARHIAWLRSIPGTPAHEDDTALVAYVGALARMYVEDPRFAATYGGPMGATFVRDTLLRVLEDRPEG